ncbi:baculoviral IAP repeat-containing protein 7-A-like [Mya arenaria]|uniref:baculoviral IAP repeat-containing protein 7-A-like n=1 Tax=Mya arenaria TaxID=6604 RepID=UPI0022E6B39F|nr:baculoviral IAP repeat-containing protein 7-A-like [Mya arenaria]
MATQIAKQKHDTSKPTPASLGISTIKPKFQQYALPSKRLESFKEASVPWPESSPVKIEDMVAAGLVYTGVGDSVRCYHCGGGLRNWEPGDDPMEQHAKWYPTCQHVLITKGKTYIHNVEAGENPDNILARRHKGKQSSEDDLASQQQREAMQAAAEFGYSEENIAIAASLFRERNGASSKFKGSDLVSIMMEMEDNPDLALNADVLDSCFPTAPSDNTEVEGDNLQSLIFENERLKESLNCKICLDRKADVIFLPCGHIVSCPQCAPALDLCPVCRKSIMGLVKAQFANTRIDVENDYDEYSE